MQIQKAVFSRILFLAALMGSSLGCTVHKAHAAEDKIYVTEYQVTLLPKEKSANVKLLVENTEERLLRKLSFSLAKNIYSNIKSNGELTIEKQRATWLPPSGKAWLSFDVGLNHAKEKKKNGKIEYDSHINKEWALFRGDDLFPPVKVVSVKNAQSKAKLEFKLPRSWKYVNTGWERDKTPGRKDRMGFFVNNPERNFDRPTGWIIAGDIATRRDLLGETVVSVSGPRRNSFEEDGVVLARMQTLTFLHFVWPEYQKLLQDTPEKLLIVGAGSPMWRGGLSGPNSLFMHADRPLVSENGTSTLLHEVFHSLTRISAKGKDDWIVEGLAEYYAIELLYRAGGMADERKELVYRGLQKRAKKVRKLRTGKSSGATTAKAVLVFHELDKEIRRETAGENSLDDVVRKLIKIRKIDLEDLHGIVNRIIKKESAALDF